MLPNLLEKTAIKRVFSGNMRRMSGNTAPIPGDRDPKCGNMSTLSEDIREKSPDTVVITGDLDPLSGNKQSLSPVSTGMFRVFQDKSSVILAMLLGMARMFGDYLCRPFVRMRAAHRVRQARLEEMEARMIVELLRSKHWEFVVHEPEETLAPYLARPLAVDLPSATRRTILAILLAFAHGLLGFLISMARTVVNWQPPLHRRATRIPLGCRPPPAWAGPWSVC